MPAKVKFFGVPYPWPVEQNKEYLGIFNAYNIEDLDTGSSSDMYQAHIISTLIDC